MPFTRISWIPAAALALLASPAFAAAPHTAYDVLTNQGLPVDWQVYEEFQSRAAEALLEPAKIEEGDIVRLKSGGPPMTVAKPPNDKGDVKCLWLSVDGYRQEGFFPAALLMLDQPRV